MQVELTKEEALLAIGALRYLAAVSRGYRHASPLPYWRPRDLVAYLPPDHRRARVDRVAALKELLRSAVNSSK